MLNYIWLAMIVIGVFVAGLLGRISGELSIAESAFGAAKVAIMTIALGLVGGMMLWLGILRLADKAGFIKIIARAIQPVMTRLFPDVPADHPAMGAMIMNMAANMLGLGNAATPLGLKAMQELDSLNPHKGTATNAMCTFLAINTSSVTLIPATAIIYVTAAGISDPFSILVPAILATLCSTIVAITMVKLLQNLPIFRAKSRDINTVEETNATDGGDDAPVKKVSARGWLFLTIVGLMMLTVCVFEFAPDIRESFLKKTGLEQVLVDEVAAQEAASELKKEKSKLEQAAKGQRQEGWRGALNSVAALVIPLIFVIFTAGALAKGVRIFEEFVEGAKEGWNVAIRIMPFLVGIMVGMVILRDSGTLLLLKTMLSPVLSALNFHPDLLPMALMRPLSGGGSSAVLAEILSNESTPLLVKYTAATMYGSTETTFYVLAVYFGSVAVRRTRHALVAGLCADAAGVIAAITICRLMFG